jgi:molecular chaperone GrpE
MAKDTKEESIVQEVDKDTVAGPAEDEVQEGQAGEAGADAEQEGESPDQEEEQEDEVTALAAQLDESRAQAAEYLDGWQRARAEFANYRRRQEQRQKQMGIEVRSRVLGQLLPVIDDLDRAFGAVPEELEDNAWVGGLSLVWRKLSGVLEKNGVSVLEIEPGDSFDPNRHEALTHEPSDEFDDGTIIQVVQHGYEIDDAILRPALVRVSSGKMQADEESAIIDEE